MEIKDIFSIKHPQMFHFAWHSRRHASLMLPLCLVGSAVIHVAALMILDVVPSRQVSAKPHFAEVSVLFPKTQEYQKIAAWLTANDPALLSSSRGSNPNREDILNTAYRPTFDSATIHLLPAPLAPVTRHQKEVILPQDIISNLAPDNENAPVSRRTALATTLEFQGELGHEHLPEGSQAPPIPEKSAETAVFLAGVLADGRIGFIFPQNGSGSAELDQEAIQYLKSLKMKENGAKKIRWGTIIFHWGANKGKNP